jgi:hypothetical protein
MLDWGLRVFTQENAFLTCNTGGNGKAAVVVLIM